MKLIAMLFILVTLSSAICFFFGRADAHRGRYDPVKRALGIAAAITAVTIVYGLLYFLLFVRPTAPTGVIAAISLPGSAFAGLFLFGFTTVTGVLGYGVGHASVGDSDRQSLQADAASSPAEGAAVKETGNPYQPPPE